MKLSIFPDYSKLGLPNMFEIKIKARLQKSYKGDDSNFYAVLQGRIAMSAIPHL